MRISTFLPHLFCWTMCLRSMVRSHLKSINRLASVSMCKWSIFWFGCCSCCKSTSPPGIRLDPTVFKSRSRKVISCTHPLPRGYIPHRPAPAIYSLYVHPLSALNNFLPDPIVPAKFRSRFQNHTFKFPLLKQRDRLTNKSVVCTALRTVLHMLRTDLVHACSACITVRLYWCLKRIKADMLFWKDVGSGILLDRLLRFKLHQS